MAIALSGGPIVFTTFPGLNRAQIVAGIYFALRAAGWAAAVIAGGYAMTATSPQSGTLAVTVSVWDPGTGTQAYVQFSGPGGLGLIHRLGTSPGRTYQIVAYPSELWISIAGNKGGSEGTNVCGGVPFLPPSSLGLTDPNCTGAGAATECWWSAGDFYGNVFFHAATPRECMNGVNSSDNVAAYASEGMFNGAYCGLTSIFDSGEGAPRIITIAHSYNSRGGLGLSHIRYPDESPLLFDPLVCWGDGWNSVQKVRGQNWNAQIVSEAHPMDDVTTNFGPVAVLDPTFGWINFTNNFFYGSLYLIVPPISGPPGPGPGPGPSRRPKTYVY